MFVEVCEVSRSEVVRDAALQSIGLLFIACPALILEKNAAVQILAQSLQGKSAPRLKVSHPLLIAFLAIMQACTRNSLRHRFIARTPI